MFGACRRRPGQQREAQTEERVSGCETVGGPRSVSPKAREEYSRGSDPGEAGTARDRLLPGAEIRADPPGAPRDCRTPPPAAANSLRLLLPAPACRPFFCVPPPERGSFPGGSEDGGSPPGGGLQGKAGEAGALSLLQQQVAPAASGAADLCPAGFARERFSGFLWVAADLCQDRQL